MTGVREWSGGTTNDRRASGSSFDTDLLHFNGDAPAGPNESYELREMVAAASAYLGQGMLDDAEELLREVLEAGYSRPDALELRRRIDDARGGDTLLLPENAPSDVPPPAPRVAFTMPLPGVERLPLHVQRMVRESDADLHAGRLGAALDAALFVIGSSPDYYPMYVRLAEIALATGRSESARTLTSVLQTCLQDAAAGQAWLLYPLRLALSPGDSSTLVAYANHLLEHPGLAPLDPVVPNAIEAELQADPAAAQQLARQYLGQAPTSDGALRLFARASVLASDTDAAATALIAHARADSPPDLLVLRAAADVLRGREEWLEWLERARSQHQRNPLSPEAASSALDLVARMVPSSRASLIAAVVRFAIGDMAETRNVVAQWRGLANGRPRDPREHFIVACADALAAERLDASDALEALIAAAEMAEAPGLRQFAESCALFGTGVAAADLFGRVVTLSRAHACEEVAIERLRQVRDGNPSALAARDALATLFLARGRTVEAVRELRYIAEQKDAAGDLHGMVAALRRISDALPTNVEMKRTLAESFMRRGALDEAMRELEHIGALETQRGNRADALAAYMRGAEVAVAIGNVKRATEFIDHAILASSDSETVRHEAVAFFLRIGAVDRAVQQLWEVVRIALQADDPDEAVAALHQIIGLTPQDPAAYHKLGEVLASLGEYAQAAKVYRRLATITPDDPVLNAKQAALAALATRD